MGSIYICLIGESNEIIEMLLILTFCEIRQWDLWVLPLPKCLIHDKKNDKLNLLKSKIEFAYWHLSSWKLLVTVGQLRQWDICMCPFECVKLKYLMSLLKCIKFEVAENTMLIEGIRLMFISLINQTDTLWDQREI